MPQYEDVSMGMLAAIKNTMRSPTNLDIPMKKYFVVQCYEKSKRIDGTMVWEVGEEGSRSRICLCYSKEMAERIAKTLEQPLPPNPVVSRR